MKKITALLIALCLALGVLSGCAGEQEPHNTTVQPRPALNGDLIREPMEASRVFSGGDGSEKSPFQIGNAQQLALMIRLIDQMDDKIDYHKAHYILTADIQLNDTTGWRSWDTVAPKYQWFPNEQMPFSGVFDGNGHSISGLYCYGPVHSSDAPDTLGLGLFGTVTDAEIRNLTIRESYIHNVDSSKSGAIAASATNTKIINCVNEAIVSGPASTGCGGIVGKISGTVKNCSNLGMVYGQGGIAGICFGSIFSCRNEGAVRYEGSGFDVGGIAGGFYGGAEGSTASDCRNLGPVSAAASKSNAGGLFGSVYAGKQQVRLEECSNRGPVFAQDNAGGVVGVISSMTDDTSSVSVCWVSNDGALSAGKSAGGICSAIHAHDSGTVSMHSCINRGSISASGQTEHGVLAGGVVASMTLTGHAQIDLRQCTNEAAIDTSVTGIGGVVASITAYAEPGKHTAILLSECRNNGNLAGAAYGMGGIAGLVTLLEWDAGNLMEIDSCTNTGSILHRSTGETNYIGGIAGNFMANAQADTIKLRACQNLGDLLYDAENLEYPENAEGIHRSFANGIVAGFHQNGVIIDCDSSGAVEVINGDSRWLIPETQLKNPELRLPEPGND